MGIWPKLWPNSDAASFLCTTLPTLNCCGGRDGLDERVGGAVFFAVVVVVAFMMKRSDTTDGRRSTQR